MEKEPDMSVGLDMMTFRCLLDIHMEMSSKQLCIQIQNSADLEMYI